MSSEHLRGRATIIEKLISRARARPPDFMIGDLDDPYLLRWWIIPRNRWFNIYLHHFLRSDDDRALHDHPWINASILLRGSYIEHTPRGEKLREPWRWWAPWRIVVRRARAAHRIELRVARAGDLTMDIPVWTLFLTGPVVRQWGFLCPHGWRHWKDFVAKTPGGNTIGRGCD